MDRQSRGRFPGRDRRGRPRRRRGRRCPRRRTKLRFEAGLTPGAFFFLPAHGPRPRSAAIAPDGRSLHVVNHHSSTVSKLRTGDMRVVQTIKVDKAPIGITYDEKAGEVWVACYSGSIMVFKDA